MSMKALRHLLDRHPGFWLLFREFGLWHDLFRWLRGKECLPSEAVALRARKGQLTLPTAVTVVSAVEILAVELLVASIAVRLILAVLSVYGVVMLWAFIASQLVRPHYVIVGEEGDVENNETTGMLVLRQGRTVLCTIPINCVAQVTKSRGYESDRRRIEEAGSSSTQKLVLGGSNGTNLCIQLENLVSVPHDTWPWQKKRQSDVGSVELWVDDPQYVLQTIQQR